jgi:hypothetical protein
MSSHTPPPPHVNSFVLGPAVINTHTALGRDCVHVYHVNSFVLGHAVINKHTTENKHTKTHAALSTLVYAYVVDCAPASSSTHRFPDDRTPIEATPVSATSAELGLGLGLGLDSLAHLSSHALPFFSPPSFHTLSLFPAFTSVWWSDSSTQASARRIS